MSMIPSRSDVCCALPAEPLRPWVDHYWLSRRNDCDLHPVLPDGSVDLVIHQAGGAAAGRVYGTSTSFMSVALEHGAHYAGIRFKPGQARHFLRAAAKELTDCCEPVHHLLSFSLDVDSIAENICRPDIFERLDAALLAHAATVHLAPARIDATLALIVSARGMLPIEQAADAFGTGRRQFERVFLDAVGIAPKLFSSIVRFHCASRLIGETPRALADVAHACGYADQSHMNRDFRRLAGMAPSAHARRHVAFVQDAPAAPADNAPAYSIYPGDWK